MSTILKTGLGNRSAGTVLSQVSPQDAAIYSTVRLKTKYERDSMRTAKLLDTVADASLAFRVVPIALGEIYGNSIEHSGASLVGLTSLLYCVIGVGRAWDSLKKMKDLEKIGDTFGADVAKAQIAINSFVAAGCTALSFVRVFDAVTELLMLLKNPLVLSSAVVTVKTVALVASVVMYVLSYAVFAGLQGLVLYGLSQGDELRERVINSTDPVKELKQHINKEMWAGSRFSTKECIDMALEEGAAWLEKLEKEVPCNQTDESRRDLIYKLFEKHPEYMTGEMGIPIGFDEMTPVGKMVRFGQFIGEKRLEAKIKNELTRQLGPDAMEVFYKESPDRNAFVAALKSASWSEWGVRWKAVAKIALCVVCSAAVVAGSFFSGGLALGIPLLILGVTGLLWIALMDGAAFISQWKSGEIRKWDKFLVGFSIFLNLVAIGTLTAFTVLSGGAPLYIGGVIFAAGWLIINTYALYLIIDNQRQPWKYQKEVTVQAFKKFLETKPSAKEQQAIFNKMSLVNRAGISEVIGSDTLEKAVERWENIRAINLKMFMDQLTEASEAARLSREIIAISSSSH